MSSGDYRVMSVLTEHMGFPPITLIDEVINAVNEIMQKALVGLSDYLQRQRNNQLKALKGEDELLNEKEKEFENQNKLFSLHEIEAGLVLFDTLCHSNLDKNFDKFELYTLRNILTIPHDLVDGGWIRLKHHEHLDMLDQTRLGSREEDIQLKNLVGKINLELHLRKILQAQLAKAKTIVKSLSQYKRCVEGLLSAHANTKLTPDMVEKLRDNLDPMNENVYYLLTQVNEVVKQVLALNNKVMGSSGAPDPTEVRFRSTPRDVYIEDKTHMLLEKIGILQARKNARQLDKYH
ncbi:hypothetical protein PUMCH_003844 [Australozyma saopauloensis]|uniref:Kinetochore-associated protein MTW1 n=1 Tax=Australozyma saopauloensis TaxID=291208 RepID=A0AAX4HFP6_9ASCO|nr:hypothetical protein PUMCH_003844 [[Candida] saopauloensis]